MGKEDRRGKRTGVFSPASGDDDSPDLSGINCKARFISTRHSLCGKGRHASAETERGKAEVGKCRSIFTCASRYDNSRHLSEADLHRVDYIYILS
jgi:hypothetical protein